MVSRGVLAKNYRGAIEAAAERVRFYHRLQMALLELPLDHVAVIDPAEIDLARRLARDAMRAIMTLPSTRRRRPKRFDDAGSDDALAALGADEDSNIEAVEQR